MRKQGSCLEKEIMQGTMPGARRRGRPCTAWMDNIKTWTAVWQTLGSRTSKEQNRTLAAKVLPTRLFQLPSSTRKTDLYRGSMSDRPRYYERYLSVSKAKPQTWPWLITLTFNFRWAMVISIKKPNIKFKVSWFKRYSRKKRRTWPIALPSPQCGQ